MADRRCSVAFTGDIGFDRYMSGRWEDDGLIAKELLDFLRGADHVVANVEGPIKAQPENTESSGAKQLLHTIDPAAVKVLNGIGADIWNLCNNHIMDAGQDGLESTLAIAAENGARTIGAGTDVRAAKEPVILDAAGGIGIFGMGYQRACRAAGEDVAGCLSWSDTRTVGQVIREIKKKCRWCVAVVHGGEEFTALPSPYVRQRYLSYLDMGADVVVSHHPHVPMNYETVGGKVIFYSLGNFIFDTDYQRSQNNTEKGVLVRLDFTEDSLSWEARGLRISREDERIVGDELPLIFRDVGPRDYELLAPLSAKLFVEATKKQMIYLYPDRFGNADAEVWKKHFAEPLRTGRVPGEALDFALILPLAEKEKEKAWRQSGLEDVKRYILEQLEDG